jgi:hypothetical protein
VFHENVKITAKRILAIMSIQKDFNDASQKASEHARKEEVINLNDGISHSFLYSEIQLRKKTGKEV